MRFVLQRVKHASVKVDGELIGSIGRGYMVLMGVSDTDTEEITDKMVDKMCKLRIFEDENGKTNLSLADVGGELLVISQFTLYADCRKGNRPSFVKAGAPQMAEKLHLPQVTYVADIQKDGNTLTVKRMLEDGYMMVKVQTPCLLTCIKELNEPRYMSVNGIFTCYDKPMEVFDYNALKDDPLIEVDTIGLKGSPTNVFKSFTPPQKGAGTMLTGDDTAAQLAGILAKKHLI